MRLGAVLFLAGIVTLQQLAELPHAAWGLLLLGLAPLAFFVPKSRPLTALAAGFLWALLHASYQLSTALPPEFEGRDVIVEGRVASLPATMDQGLRFIFDVDRMWVNGDQRPAPARLRLSWYTDPAEIHAGEQWRLTVRLKRPHGFRNPGGFDFEAGLFQQGIRATGYVRLGDTNRRLAEGPGSQWTNHWRQGLRDALYIALAQHPHRGVITALAIGDREAITDAQWDTLMATGTNHLVAISGLHVGMVAAVMFFLMRRLWPWLGNAALYWPAPKAAAVAALIGAAAYAALAGFAVPTQRALVMIAVAMAGVIWSRQTPPSHILALALWLVLLLDPFAVMAGGFWLSFGAVAVLLYGMAGRLGRGGLWWQWGRVQWLATVGLVPALLIFFQQAAVLSPLANLIAVPWVSVAVVPLTLAGTFLVDLVPALGHWLIRLAADLWGLLWPVLGWLGQLDFALWTQHAPPLWTLLPAIVGLLWLLAPRGVPARWLGLIWLAPMVWVRPPAPAEGEFWFTLLDVGQGLSAVVRTRTHTLLYDTGPRFSDHFDTGDAVVVPFLRYSGLRHLDTLMVSHGDNDHIGGTKSVWRYLNTHKVLTSVPQRLQWADAVACVSGMHWRWDGVDFKVLHPSVDTPDDAGNNRSCVLRVDAVGGSVLLPGDIEKGAEKVLLQQSAERLRADILVVPHHGSRTSSTAAFVDAVRPAYALFPIGYRNRFGFPKPAVVERYRKRGVTIFDSARHGAITFKVTQQGPVAEPRTHRQVAARYWHAR